MRNWFWVLMLLLCTGATMAAEEPVTLRAGDVQVRYQPNQGRELRFAGIPLGRGSTVQLYKPDWSQGYYSSNNVHPRAKFSPDRTTMTVHHAATKHGFDATETVRVVSGNRIEVTLEGKLTSDIDARIEWAIAYINAFAMYGGSYGDAETIIPEPAIDNGTGTVIGDTREMTLKTRVGDVQIKVEEGPSQLSLIDGRKAPARWWQREAPSLWLGMLGAKVTPSEPFRFRVSIEFTPKPAAQSADSVTVEAKAIELAEALVPRARQLQIIPKPKSLKWNAGRFVLAPNQKIVAVDPQATRALEVLNREIATRFGWTWQPSARPDPGTPGAIQFLHDVSGKIKPEGYMIEIAPRGVTILASDPAGHFYAAQTLCQLFQVDRNDVFWPSCSIDDYPSLAFRGVHLFTGKDSLAFHRKLVERIFSRYKYNHIVIEADYTQWETNPKLWNDISVPKQQVRDYVKFARENNLTPIPLVQSLGHGEWMFTNGQNRDIAEFPEKPYAYDATNPKTYEFIEKIYSETMEMFDSPKFFHIGHDEVTIFGNYPHREEGKKWGVTKLFLFDVNKLNAFFEPKSTRLMLWGDMLLHRTESNDPAANAESPEEAKERRNAIPKSAVICDWHYDAAKPEAYKSLKVFKDEGFTTIACPWFNPENIHAINAGARLYGAWGTLQTTWAGYSIREETLSREFKQFSAYILGGEYSWSGDSPAPGDLPYRADDIFVREFNRGRQAMKISAGAQLDLSQATNVSLTDWLGFGPKADMSSLSASELKDDVALRFSNAIMLAGKLAPAGAKLPPSVTLTTSVKAAEVAILHATSFPANRGENVGSYQIIFDDGTRAEIPLIYGENIRAWDDSGATTTANLAWSGKTQSDLPIGLRLLRRTNPHPEKSIAKIVFATDHLFASPALFAITAISP